LPEETCRKLRLTVGAKFKLLSDDEGVLVLKLMETGLTSVTEADLRLQQSALPKIWDDPNEDMYDANV
jgi:hypothetical protein